MEEKDLIEKLETVRLPEAELPQYKNRLKMALLQRVHSAGFTEKINISMKGVITNMNNILTSRQPVWRVGLSVMLVTALLVSLSIMLPSFLGQDKVIMATENEVMQILKADPETKALLDDGAMVNFIEGDYLVDLLPNIILPFSDEDVIAKIEEETGIKITSYQKTGVLIEAYRMMVEITLGDKIYMADVDVLNGKVLCFGEKGSPDLRSINPRFAAQLGIEIVTEDGESFATYSSIGSCRSWDGVQYYIDSAFKDKLSYQAYEPGEYEPGEPLPNSTIIE